MVLTSVEFGNVVLQIVLFGSSDSKVVGSTPIWGTNVMKLYWYVYLNIVVDGCSSVVVFQRL